MAVDDELVFLTQAHAPVFFQLLANDTDADNDLLPESISLVTAPSHGTVSLRCNILTSEYVVLTGTVDSTGTIRLNVSGEGDTSFQGNHTSTGDYRLLIQLGRDNADGWLDPSDSDFQFDGTLAPGFVDGFQIPGLTPGTPFVAWIDYYDAGFRDKYLGLLGPPTGEVIYTPDLHYRGPDSFTYTVRDGEGSPSNTATVSIDVQNLPLVAVDDAFSISLVLDSGEPPEAAIFDVFNNDGLLHGLGSVMITSPPAHGTAEVDARPLFSIEPFPVNWANSLDDDSSPLGDGHASALQGIVDKYGQVQLKVSQYWDAYWDGTNYVNGLPGWGEYALYVRLGVEDFSEFDANVFDFEFRDRLEPLKVDSYVVSGQNPRTPFIAWIDNTVGSGTPDTYMTNLEAQKIGYVPELGFSGTDSFRYAIVDADGAISNEATVTVTYVNQPSVLGDDEFEIPQDTPTELNLFANDEDRDTGLDWSSIVIATAPAHGTLDVQTYEWGTSVVYTPDAGFIGEDAFTYTVNDLLGVVSEEAAVSLRVLDTNQPPLLQDDFDITLLDTPLVMDVLANDYDPDGTLDPSSLSIAMSPQHGAANIEQTASGPMIRYQPDAGYEGDDFFTYTVRDDRGAISSAATVSIHVGNWQPEANADFLLAAFGAPASIDVLSNDLDPDGSLDPSTLAIVSPPEHGLVVVQQSPSGPVVIYTPDAGFLGDDSFDYTVADDAGAISGVATVYVTVQRVAEDDEATTTGSTPVAVDVLANDSTIDANLLPATLEIVAMPARGSVALEETEAGLVVVYTPEPDIFASLVVDDPIDRDDGNYSTGHLSLREAIRLAHREGTVETFTYMVADDRGLRSNLATVTIQVAPQPTTITFAPSLTAQGPRTLTLSHVGDTSEGNTALAIRSDITIVGPTGNKRITLAGPGNSGDLRLFLVATGGTLTLENLRLTNGATDGSGGALAIAGGGAASLENCILTNNFAYDQGGAIHNLGTLTLVSSQFTRNQANQGGAIANFASLVVTAGSFTSNQAELGGALDNAFGTATFAGVTFSTNSAYDRGGAIFNSGVLSLTNTIVSANRAVEGGGFFNLGSATLTDSTISGNRADQGGGFKNGATADVLTGIGEREGLVTLTNTTIFGNIARQGGGIYNIANLGIDGGAFSNNRASQGGGLFQTDSGLLPQPAHASLSETAITGNHAEQGGGIYVDLGYVMVADSLFSGNMATGNGGALFNRGGVSVFNTTFAGNSASSGGAAYVHLGSTSITNTTIANNTATRGGGIYNDVGYVSLVSSIVASNRSLNRANDIAGPTPVAATASWNNLIGSGGSGGLVAGQHDNQVGVAPILAALGDYGGSVKTMALLPGSPAIDRGSGDQPDARGIGPVGPRDIGAFESQGFTLTVAGGSGQSIATGRPFRLPLRVTVAAKAQGEPVVGGAVTFTVPDFGASAHLSTERATISAARTASVTARANGVGGSYDVLATAAGVEASVAFALTNLGSTSVQGGSSAGQASAGQSQSSGSTSSTLPMASQTNGAAAVTLSDGYITLPVDATEYQLDSSGRLRRRTPGGQWSQFADGVRAFQKAPNGDVYLLNERQELRRFQLGHAWTTLQVGVEAIAMDAKGTLHALDSLNQVSMYASLDRYYVLPEIPTGGPATALDPPSVGASAKAASLVPDTGSWVTFDGAVYDLPFGPDFPLQNELDALTSAASLTFEPPAGVSETIDPPNQAVVSFTNVRFVAEQISDLVEAPRRFPEIGWAQLHHAQYKVTIYCSTLFNEDAQLVLFMSHDHLHLTSAPAVQAAATTSFTSPDSDTFVVPSNVIAAPTNRPLGSRPGNSPTLGGVYRDEVAPALATGPDGTIYKFGVVDIGHPSLGIEPGTHSLWRLVPGGHWEALFRAYAFAVGPDNTLFVLNGAHELQSQAAGSTEWTTLDRQIVSFSLAPNGTLYALTFDHQLQKLAAGSHQWTTLDTEVSSYALWNDGTLFAVNRQHELRRLNVSAGWTTLDRGVTSIAVTPEDVLFVLNGRHELRTLAGRSNGDVVQREVQSFTRERDGTLYALTTGRDLKRLPPAGVWEVVDRGILSYLVTPNGDLYEINQRHELKRQKFGYSWSTLGSDVESIQYDAYGAVVAMDRLNRIWTYASLDRYYVLPTLQNGQPHVAGDPPSDQEVMRSAAMDSSRGNGQGRVDWPDALHNDVQYFAPGPEFPLTRELESGLLNAEEGSLQAWLAAEDLNDSLSTTSLITPEAAIAGLFRPGDYLDHDREFDVSAYNNVRIVKEKIVDKIDPVRYFPNIGLAQVHHAQYKATIYFTALGSHYVERGLGLFPSFRSYQVVAEDQQVIVFIDHDHLHLVDDLNAAQAILPNLPSAMIAPDAPAAAEFSSVASTNLNAVQSIPGSPLQRRRDQNAVSLTAAPDGTLYKLGAGNTAWAKRGSEPAPYYLYQMPVNGIWKPIDYVYSFAVASDSRLYILDTEHVLRTPALGPTHWATLATDVKSFHVAKNRTLFALQEGGELRTLADGAEHWSTLTTGVRTMMQSPAGTTYALNDRQELLEYLGGSNWRILDWEVASFAMTDDGALYELNGQRELKRLRDQQPATVLARGVTEFQVAPDGGVYALTAGGPLMRLTARDHWTVLDPAVVDFQISPNGDLYLITDQHELRRQKVGYSWMTLQADVQSFQVYSDGGVYAYDSTGTPTIYNSLGPYFELGSIAPGDAIQALDPPSDGEVVDVANLVSYPGVQYFAPGPEFPLAREIAAYFQDYSIKPGHVPGLTTTRLSPELLYSSATLPIPDLLIVQNVRIVKEKILDQIDPPRLVPHLGVAMLHRAQYRCTIYYDTADSVDLQLVVYIDHDHYHTLGVADEP